MVRLEIVTFVSCIVIPIFISPESTYTERYMGLPLPSENFRGYQKSSLIERCQGIEGKEFFLAHGMADRNVHIQNSMILAKTLVSNNIPFEQHVKYPHFSLTLLSIQFFFLLSVLSGRGSLFVWRQSSFV